MSIRKGSIADDLKARARAASGKQPPVLTISGWKFILSYGEVPPITQEQYEFAYDSIAAKFGLTGPKQTWEEFSKELAAAKASGAPSGLSRLWILSASLFPAGRSSTEKDWRFLGEMLRALGAPKDSLRTPLETTPPNAVHFWTWNDPK